MQVEIVDFYEDIPKKIFKPKPGVKAKKAFELVGTLHVYLPELQLDIRGIRLTKNENFVFVNMPFKKNIDKDTGKEVTYPLVSLIDKEKHRNMIKSIRTQAIEFMKTWTRE